MRNRNNKTQKILMKNHGVEQEVEEAKITKTTKTLKKMKVELNTQQVMTMTKVFLDKKILRVLIMRTNTMQPAQLFNLISLQIIYLAEIGKRKSYKTTSWKESKTMVPVRLFTFLVCQVQEKPPQL